MSDDLPPRFSCSRMEELLVTLESRRAVKRLRTFQSLCIADGCGSEDEDWPGHDAIRETIVEDTFYRTSTVQQARDLLASMQRDLDDRLRQLGVDPDE